MDVAWITIGLAWKREIIVDCIVALIRDHGRMINEKVFLRFSQDLPQLWKQEWTFGNHARFDHGLGSRILQFWNQFIIWISVLGDFQHLLTFWVSLPLLAMSVMGRQVSPPMVLQVPGERGSECEENVSLDMGTESDDESDEVEMQSPGRMSPGSQTSHGLEPTVELQLAQMGQLVAESISKMEVTHPEVLRATRAFHAFQNFAVALRVGCDGDFYEKSRKTARISTFWSHSWHGGHWNKIITLLFFYNGTIAILVGFLMATALGLLFFSSDILPGFYRGLHEGWSTWSLCGGSLAAGFVFLLWRPQTLVFLDRICISQNDSDLKTQAIFSLAGLLKNSDTMLILWDPTWTERLWCLFELAAFLKSKKTQEQTLIVRPIFLGPISVTLFVTMFAFGLPINLVPIDDWTTALVPIAFALLSGVAVGFWTLSTLRSYFRDLDTMKEQLLSISFDRTRAACCDQNHVGPGGQVLLCDRKVVKTCVIWLVDQHFIWATVKIPENQFRKYRKRWKWNRTCTEHCKTAGPGFFTRHKTSHDDTVWDLGGKFATQKKVIRNDNSTITSCWKLAPARERASE